MLELNETKDFNCKFSIVLDEARKEEGKEGRNEEGNKKK